MKRLGLVLLLVVGALRLQASLSLGNQNDGIEVFRVTSPGGAVTVETVSPEAIRNFEGDGFFKIERGNGVGQYEAPVYAESRPSLGINATVAYNGSGYTGDVSSSVEAANALVTYSGGQIQWNTWNLLKRIIGPVFAWLGVGGICLLIGVVGVWMCRLGVDGMRAERDAVAKWEKDKAKRDAKMAGREASIQARKMRRTIERYESRGY